jgi:hypothetical protein
MSKTSVAMRPERPGKQTRVDNPRKARGLVHPVGFRGRYFFLPDFFFFAGFFFAIACSPPFAVLWFTKDR